MDETLWRIVHASTIWAIHKTTKTAREHQHIHIDPTPQEMYKEMQRMAQRMMEKTWMMRERYSEQWAEWRRAGWVSTTPQVRLHVMSREGTGGREAHALAAGAMTIEQLGPSGVDGRAMQTEEPTAEPTEKATNGAARARAQLQGRDTAAEASPPAEEHGETNGTRAEPRARGAQTAA